MAVVSSGTRLIAEAVARLGPAPELEDALLALPRPAALHAALIQGLRSEVLALEEFWIRLWIRTAEPADGELAGLLEREARRFRRVFLLSADRCGIRWIHDTLHALEVGDPTPAADYRLPSPDTPMPCRGIASVDMRSMLDRVPRCKSAIWSWRLAKLTLAVERYRREHGSYPDSLASVPDGRLALARSADAGASEPLPVIAYEKHLHSNGFDEDLDGALLWVRRVPGVPPDELGRRLARGLPVARPHASVLLGATRSRYSAAATPSSD